ncbi:oxidoreductase C-terminal domain-containing protein [Streptomyces sp. NPDC048420]|uniref:oxidoreductase C-terminal domain-containing protein n=1 Tax=Streptomyces sp. NPDC048420 TaxID=3155755 RepID=UPI003446E3C8
MTETVVVIGAGQAGVQAAVSARERGYGGRLVVVGAETHPPYQRPPLSKERLRDGLDDIAGLVGEGDEIVTRGDPAVGPFTAFHLRGGTLVAAESIDAASDHVAARRLLGPSGLRGEQIDRELLADPTTNLRTYAAHRAEETVR